MADLLLGSSILIDEVETVLDGISIESGMEISGIETIARFIREEKNTMFYLDPKMTCNMQPTKNSEYLWLDTGLMKNGNPIFISTLRKQGKYIGHYYGTMEKLSGSMRQHVTGGALRAFRAKYENKIQQRAHRHITNEMEYILGKCNESAARTPDPANTARKSASGTMASMIAALGLEFPDAAEEQNEGQNDALNNGQNNGQNNGRNNGQNHSQNNGLYTGMPEDTTGSENTVIPIEKYVKNDFEEEITIGLLLDKIDDMQNYMDELLAKIDELSSKSEAKDKDIENLKARNDEYKQAMVQMRTFIEDEQDQLQARQAEANKTAGAGHLLLAGKKILVLGDCSIDEKLMKGLAKRYGFENSDLEFHVDYTKVVSATDRIKNSGRFYAVIFGKCPHKVKKLDKASSFIEQCKQDETMPLAVDARTKSGELKASKDSFTQALITIARNLQMKAAG